MFLKICGIKKLRRDHNSFILFCRGVPVNRSLLEEVNFLNVLQIKRQKDVKILPKYITRTTTTTSNNKDTNQEL